MGKKELGNKKKKGKELVHHFSVADKAGSMYFKLALNTATLHWVLEEYMLASEARVHYASWEAA